MATRFYSSVEYGAGRGSTDPDVLYFNATINNNSTGDIAPNGVNPQVTATYQRTYPLLQDASDYMASIVRLSSNGATRNLPILIPQIRESAITGAQWLGTIQGVNMKVQSTPPPVIIPGSVVSGYGTAQLSSGGNPVGSIPYTIGLTNAGAPVLASIPPPPGSTTWTLSGNLADGFWPGGNGFPAGLYTVSSLSSGSFFVGSAQNDVDATVYSFTLENVSTGAISQRFVEWETQELTAPVPLPPVITQNLGTEYYYCYSYQWWLYLCNKALALAWADIGSPGTFAPEINSLNPPTGGAQIFSLEASQDMEPSASPDINIYMNVNMANLFANFPGVWTNQDTGRAFQFYASSYITGTTSYLTSTQEFPSTSGWSPVDALVVTTSQVPIVAEQTTPPSLVGYSDTGFNRGVSEAAFQPILADVARPEVQGAEDWRQDFVYEPSGEYRMISLTAQSSPISAVDLLVWWRNRLDDSLYPLRLSNGSSFSVKLMFRRKQMGV